MSTYKRFCTNLALFMIVLFLASACSNRQEDVQPKRSKAPQEAVEKWKDLRFGMFIHWGPVSLTNVEKL